MTHFQDLRKELVELNFLKAIKLSQMQQKGLDISTH